MNEACLCWPYSRNNLGLLTRDFPVWTLVAVLMYLSSGQIYFLPVTSPTDIPKHFLQLATGKGCLSAICGRAENDEAPEKKQGEAAWAWA